MTQFGAERIRAALPDVEVLEVPIAGDVPAGVAAEVLFGVPIWSPTLADLLGRGVTWLHLAGTGVDTLPPEAFEGRVVTCARGAAAVPIAEFCLAAMLAAVKSLPESWIEGPPEQPGMAQLGELNGQTLGLVGLGGIGTALAERARAMGMRVVAVRRTGAPGPEGVEVVGDLGDLLGEADHLVLAAPATARTHHLLDADAFKRAKPGVHVVNIARGSLIDHDALLEALDDGTVGRATLDVTEPEPLPAGHPLYTHPRAKISAHISWSSPRAFERMIDLFIENVRRCQRGETLEGVVDVDEGY
ncbi:MAG TPA: NAD(P)-dependent oxidoreductase [Acidimicrobiales bacterium]|nr:NAD(P)-dependent oxidoreductase [Acidimicrobiales bacterium]